jgi:hypothetical protein
MSKKKKLEVLNAQFELECKALRAFYEANPPERRELPASD